MQHFLMKSEPDAYGWDQLVAEKRGRWDGVRNHRARNNLRAMAVGDLALFYHSVKGREVAGVMRVVKAAYPDPTAEDGDWVCVEVEPVVALKERVTLATIKADVALAEMELVKISRLSVCAVTAKEFKHILKLGKTSLPR